MMKFEVKGLKTKRLITGDAVFIVEVSKLTSSAINNFPAASEDYVYLICDIVDRIKSILDDGNWTIEGDVLTAIVEVSDIPSGISGIISKGLEDVFINNIFWDIEVTRLPRGRSLNIKVSVKLPTVK